MKRQFQIFCLIISLFILNSNGTASDKFINYVNPFIGTTNGGNTFPGAVRPWGMVSVSPHTALGAPSGYIYGQPWFYGFGHVHLSGTGCADLGSVIITVARDKLINPMQYKSNYTDEIATAGYYSIMLPEVAASMEVTSTKRSGLIRIKTLQDGYLFVLIDAGRSLNLVGGGKISINHDNSISGYNIAGGFCGEANRQEVYFFSEVNKNIVSSGIWKGNQFLDSQYISVVDTAVGAWIKFDLKKGETILIKTGISYVGEENAKINVRTEIPAWDFETKKRTSELEWNDVLSKIEIEDPNENNKTKFYTSLYHMMIHPNIINDCNGEYPLMGRKGIGKYENRNRYSVFSLWDTYRTLHPFLTLVYPERQSEMIQTMVDMYIENGYLPKWELAGHETYMMVGDPASIVIADSYMKGIYNFNVDSAFTGMIKPAIFESGEKAPPVRAGYHELMEYGYIPFEQDWSGDWWVWGPVSTSLEYNLADFAIGQMAKEIGKKDVADMFYNRSLLYRNLFDSQTQLLRPKLKNGDWLKPFDEFKTEGSGDWEGSGGPGYVEGNAWNYTWFVPHDIPGLIELFGGPEPFSKKLQNSFDNGQFTINNEPDISYPYLFTYIKDQEQKTAEIVHQIMENDFGTGPDGLPGNDDCGTISAWFVFSALGFYPDCPAKPEYRLSYPLFKKSVIHLNKNYYSGDQIIIEKNQRMDNIKTGIYWNRDFISLYKIEHNEMIKGGKLSFK